MLTNLFLRDNKIGDEGCEHLAKGDWNIFTLDLSIPILIRGINQISDIGVRFLGKANWPHLSKIELCKDHIY